MKTNRLFVARGDQRKTRRDSPRRKEGVEGGKKLGGREGGVGEAGREDGKKKVKWGEKVVDVGEWREAVVNRYT